MRESTPQLLQEDLKAELEKLFKEQTFLTPPLRDGEEPKRAHLNVFKQWVPVSITGTRQDEITPEMIEQGKVDTYTADRVFPYIIVRISEGKIKNPSAEQAVNIVLIFGVYDPDENNTGYLDILHMIETIRHRFFSNPILSGKFECISDMDWAMQDEESYPYNFGSLSMNFLTAAIRREDRYA